jgi:peptidase M23-like protein
MSRPVRLAVALGLVLLARAASPPPATASGVAWARPVPGDVARAFAYDAAQPFTRGQHRGVDLAAAPGAPVRAACAGRVVTARAGQVVTLRCGPWRVTHLPIAGVRVRAGARVAAGARIGTLGRSREHRGLHVGVRRAGDPFGYVDPLTFLPRSRPRLAPPLAAPTGRPRHRLAPPPRAPATGRVPRRLPVPAHRAAPRAAAPGVRVLPPQALAPWPAWVGLALVLCGALGGGLRRRARARRVRGPATAREGIA